MCSFQYLSRKSSKTSVFKASRQSLYWSETSEQRWVTAANLYPMSRHDETQPLRVIEEIPQEHQHNHFQWCGSVACNTNNFCKCLEPRMTVTLHTHLPPRYTDQCQAWTNRIRSEKLHLQDKQWLRATDEGWESSRQGFPSASLLSRHDHVGLRVYSLIDVQFVAFKRKHLQNNCTSAAWKHVISLRFNDPCFTLYYQTNWISWLWNCPRMCSQSELFTCIYLEAL